MMNTKQDLSTKLTAMNRRKFFGVIATGTAAVSTATLLPATTFASADKSAGTAGEADRKRLKYFGPDANVRKNYHKFLGKPATVIDFGLTPTQEERARQLHKTLHVFDGIPEVGYYDGLLDDLLRSGCASPCGS